MSVIYRAPYTVPVYGPPTRGYFNRYMTPARGGWGSYYRDMRIQRAAALQSAYRMRMPKKKKKAPKKKATKKRYTWRRLYDDSRIMTNAMDAAVASYLRNQNLHEAPADVQQHAEATATAETRAAAENAGVSVMEMRQAEAAFEAIEPDEDAPSAKRKRTD